MAEGILQYYTIKEGDTLMSISIKMYKSPEYVDALMNANGIKEGDTIYPGGKNSYSICKLKMIYCPHVKRKTLI